MKNIIKHTLLIEGRLEDSKKKWSTFPSDFVDSVSEQDPSGNNKYLDWILRNIYMRITRGGRYDTPGEVEMYFQPRGDGGPYDMLNDRLNRITEDALNTVQLFHKNVDRLTPERVYEALENTLGHIPTNLTIVRLDNGKNGIWESKNINMYNIFSLRKILDYVMEHYPSKSELNQIKNRETINIYEDDNIKIVAPQSFASSCMYGANTRWCTTSKHKGQEYFDMYTKKNMALIYFIFKKPKTFDEVYSETDLNSIEVLMDREIRQALGQNPELNKLALYFDIKKGTGIWFNEADNMVDGLSLLKAYIRLTSTNPDQEFKTIKSKLNGYIASKDERSTIRKMIKRGRI